MLKIEKIYPKDIIAFVVLIFSLSLIARGVNNIVSGIVIMIITYYFVGRIDGNGEPKRDLHERVEKVEQEIKEIPKTQPVPSKFPSQTEPPTEAKYTHELKPVPIPQIPTPSSSLRS